MAIARLGASGASATSIAIPGTYNTGDLLVIFAANTGSSTQPSPPAGWTNLASGAAGSTANRTGWKRATSNAETSGTWTSATDLICHVYSGITSAQVPITMSAAFFNTGSTATYNTLIETQKNAWVGAFGYAVSTSSSMEAAPSGMTNRVDLISATAEIVSFDSNGIYPTTGAFPQTTTNIVSSVFFCTRVFTLIAEPLGPINNYQFADAGDGVSTTEKAF